MKSILIHAAMLLAWCSCSPASANVRLAEEKQCLQCHAIDADTIGPSFRKIGAIYRTMKQPERRLIEVMRLGSDAHLGSMWGKARMPDNSERPEISDDEATRLARWILKLK